MFFYRLWLLYKTKNLSGECGMLPIDNIRWQHTPRHWLPQYQTKRNYQIWILTGKLPWKDFYIVSCIKSLDNWLFGVKL